MRKLYATPSAFPPFLFSLAALLCCAAVVGCGRPKPDGMPKLFPCSVKVLQDGAPLADATVTFYGADDFKWAVSGATDANGVAKMHTHGTYPGVPEGQYSVTITKNVVEKPEVDPNASASLTVNGGQAYDLVDAQFKMKDSTPLTITVSGKTSEEFDVGAAVRDSVQAL